MADKNVRFIRVNGRVIPIKQHQSEERKKAAGLVTAGVGVGVAAGKLSGKMHHTAAHFDNSADTYHAAAAFNKADTNPFRLAQKNRAAAQFTRLAQKSAKEGTRLTRNAKLVQQAGFGTTSALLSAGGYKLIPRKVKKEHPNTSKAIAGAAGLTAAFLLRSSFYHTIGKWPKGKSAVWESAKLAAKRVASKGTKGGGI